MDQSFKQPYGEAYIDKNVKLLNVDLIPMSRPIPPYKPEMKIPKMEFKDFIEGLLEKHNLAKAAIKSIVSDKVHLQALQYALTDSSADPVHNLEMYEIMGDASIHHAITRFIVQRFPQLASAADPQAIVANLRTTLEKGSTGTFLAYQLGFTPYIQCEEETLKDNFVKVLEDSFEAFYGCLEIIIDSIKGDEKSSRGFKFIEEAITDLLSTTYEKEFATIDEILNRKAWKEVYLRLDSSFKTLKEIMGFNTRVIEFEKKAPFDRTYFDMQAEEKIDPDGVTRVYCKCRAKLHILDKAQKEFPEMPWSYAMGKKDVKELAATNAINYLKSIHVGYREPRGDMARRDKRPNDRCKTEAQMQAAYAARDRNKFGKGKPHSPPPPDEEEA